ncbi:MAG: FkbM family methyltransferase [Bacteroidales bacterium]|nr:FkbM family methyltransferase [Bacteroidales bacterium]
MIERIHKLLAPHYLYITDSLGGSFKSFFISNNMNEKISRLKKNLDKESLHILDIIMQRILHYPDESFKRKIPKKVPVIGGLLEVEKYDNRIKVNKYLSKVKKECGLPRKYIQDSVFYYKHGLLFLPSSVEQYISNQDFIDIGAFIGDSAISLKQYNYKKIYSIEVSRKSIANYKTNLEKCKISSENYEVINVCIESEDHHKPVKLPDTGSAGLSVNRKSGKYDFITVEQKSLDSIVADFKINPRFIKVDIEGNCLKFVNGAKKTLLKYRPVLSLAIYHNPGEFFDVKPALENILDNYTYVIRKLSGGIINNQCHSEIILLAYPKEII